jgi:nicotinamide riboside transporter PnuC
MALIREYPPIMVLTEETPDYLTFRFKSQGWAVATLIPGIILVAVVLYLYAIGNPSTLLLAVVGLFGFLLIFSSIYSLSSDQWLTADGRTKTIKFHKQNIYGLTNWERSANEFEEIRVWKSRKAINWATTIVCKDGLLLQIGENVFGAMNYEKALDLANKVSNRSDIKVDAYNK